MIQRIALRGESAASALAMRGAALPSATENVYKIFAESAEGSGHLARFLAGANEVVSVALGT